MTLLTENTNCLEFYAVLVHLRMDENETVRISFKRQVVSANCGADG